MDRLNTLMKDAGLQHLMIGGRRKPYQIIASLMSKNKEKNYEKPPIAGFNLNKVSNKSEFLQKRYGDSADIKPFDYCQAQQRKEAEKIRIENLPPDEREAEMLRDEVHKPQYWGLEWKDLKKSGKWYITKEGLRFPPVKWTNKKYGEVRWALAYIDPKLPTEKKKGTDGVMYPTQKRRYKMLFFKEDLPKNLPDVPKEEVEEKKIEKRGVELEGTNVVKYEPEATTAYNATTVPTPTDPFEGMTTQDIKDELHRLIGRPDQVGKKNTPAKYGSTNTEIKANVLRLREEKRAKEEQKTKKKLPEPEKVKRTYEAFTPAEMKEMAKYPNGVIIQSVENPDIFIERQTNTVIKANRKNPMEEYKPLHEDDNVEDYEILEGEEAEKILKAFMDRNKVPFRWIIAKDSYPPRLNHIEATEFINNTLYQNPPHLWDMKNKGKSSYDSVLIDRALKMRDKNLSTYIGSSKPQFF